MKNKNLFNLLIVSAVALCTSTISMAQGAYLKVGGGYGFGTNKSTINSYFLREFLVETAQFSLLEQSMFNYENNQIEVIKKSLGQGGSFGIAGGYMFSKHIGAELGLSYFIGQKIDSKLLDPPSSSIVEEKKANTFFVNPSLVVAAGAEGVNPYARVGALIGVAPKISSTLTLTDPNDVVVITDELTGGIAVGFSAALGITYPISPKISVFGELAYNGLSYKPTQREITKVTENGVNKAVTDVYDFVKHPIKDIVPDQYFDKGFDADSELSHSYPFSSLGLNLGVQFNFGGGGLARSR